MTKRLKCFCCGKEYDLCTHCPTNVGYAPWRTMHCSINHFKIFEIAREYKNGTLTRAEAIEQLSRTDITGYKYFDTQTGEVLREILSDDQPDTIEPITSNTDGTSEGVLLSKPRAKRNKKN